MTPGGIEPTTFQFVAQHLNHCATAVPLLEKWYVLLTMLVDYVLISVIQVQIRISYQLSYIIIPLSLKNTTHCNLL